MMPGEPICADSQGVEVNLLSRLEPMGALSRARLQELVPLCLVETVGRGMVPAGFPERRRSVYLLSGELKIDFHDGSSMILVGGSEASLRPLYRRPGEIRRGKAITDVRLLRVEDETLDIMMTWDQLSKAVACPDCPEVTTDWEKMSEAFRLSMLTGGALSRLPPASIHELFGRFERVLVNAGDTLVREGDPGDYYYLVERGRCSVTRKVGGVDMPLAELKAGDAFGEEALVSDNTRNATVSMRTAGVLLRLSKEDFVELLREPLLRRLSWEEAGQRAAAGAVWLDVRFPSEYRSGHLPGAISVPLGEIRNAIDVLDREPEYLVYCRSGRRSSAAAFILAQRGYRAFCLAGDLPEGTELVGA